MVLQNSLHSTAAELENWLIYYLVIIFIAYQGQQSHVSY